MVSLYHRFANEFAAVVIEVLDLKGGMLLRVQDPRSGATVDLDPIELEALTRLSLSDRAVLVDPSLPGLPLSHVAISPDMNIGNEFDFGDELE